MVKISAGILVYRQLNSSIEVLLVHPGGPFWRKKDIGAWSIPKGQIKEGEDPLLAARREFKEETGQDIEGDFMQLQPVKLKSGKKIFAWAVEGWIDASKIVSNEFPLEWPPKSGKMVFFPELDKAGWFDMEQAKTKINPGQVAFLLELEEKLKSKPAWVHE